MKVQDCMTSPARSCTASASLVTAAEIMWESKIGALPVLDPEGHPIGMITDRDICMAAARKGRFAGEISVRETMSPNPFTARPTTTLRRRSTRWPRGRSGAFPWSITKNPGSSGSCRSTTSRRPPSPENGIFGGGRRSLGTSSRRSARSRNLRRHRAGPPPRECPTGTRIAALRKRCESLSWPTSTPTRKL